MSGELRRRKIAEVLETRLSPLSATDLAKKFDVTRQTIVGDIALLRASGMDILATPNGYIISSNMSSGKTILRTLACSHGPDDLEKEIYTIIDNGGEVLDVIVEHPLYGQLTGRLDILSRFDARRFIDNVHKQNVPLLSRFTEGIHLHTIRCKDEQMYERILSALYAQGILLSKE